MDQQAGRIVKVETEVRLNAPPEKVFAAFTTELDKWWAFRINPACRIVFEPWPGGRIYEDWNGAAGALYGIVALLDPPNKLVSRGGLTEAWHAVNTEEAVPDGDGTIYRKSLRLWGEISDEAAEMFTQGTRAIAEQLIKQYVEDGIGYPVP